MRLLWEDRAWSDYLYWQTQDKKTLKKINGLIKDITETDRAADSRLLFCCEYFVIVRKILTNRGGRRYNKHR